MGFVLVRNMAGASKKCERLMQTFDAPLPAPLSLVKFSTGLGEGVHFDGDVLIFIYQAVLALVEIL